MSNQSMDLSFMLEFNQPVGPTLRSNDDPLFGDLPAYEQEAIVSMEQAFASWKFEFTYIYSSVRSNSTTWAKIYKEGIKKLVEGNPELGPVEALDRANYLFYYYAFNTQNTGGSRKDGC